MDKVKKNIAEDRKELACFSVYLCLVSRLDLSTNLFIVTTIHPCSLTTDFRSVAILLFTL